jgi:hypothetical protein
MPWVVQQGPSEFPVISDAELCMASEALKNPELKTEMPNICRYFGSEPAPAQWWYHLVCHASSVCMHAALLLNSLLVMQAALTYVQKPVRLPSELRILSVACMGCSLLYGLAQPVPVHRSPWPY